MIRQSVLDTNDLEQLYNLLNLHTMHVMGQAEFESPDHVLKLKLPTTEEERNVILDQIDVLLRKVIVEQRLSQRTKEYEAVDKLASQLAEAKRENLKLRLELSKLKRES
jgi:radical SAM superfamily enzyme